MSKNPGLKIQVSTDKDAFHTSWDWSIDKPITEEETPNKNVETLPSISSKLVLHKKAVNVLKPFIYIKEKTMEWSDDLKLKMIAPSSMINQYWETHDGVKLLSVLHETAEDMKFITSSKGYLLYVVDETINRLFICSKSLQEIDGKRYTWNIATGQTIAVYAARELKYAVVNNDVVDARFFDGQGLGLFPYTNILAIPVKNDKTCVAVIELYRDNGVSYTKDNIQVTTYLTSLVADVIFENQKQVLERKNDQINDFLLESLHSICLSNNDGKNDRCDDLYIKHAMSSASFILNSESVTYFSLIDHKHLTRSFSNHMNPVSNLTAEKKVLRVAKEIEVANVIRRSQTIVNFVDVFNDPRFDKSIDRQIGLLIRSVLGFHVCNRNGNCGVLMAINKQVEAKFTFLDENVFELLAKYFSIGLEFVHALKTLANQERILKGLYEVFGFQLSRRFTLPEVFSVQETIYIPKNFYQFSFVPKDPQSKEIPKYIFHMINNLVPSLIPSKTQLYNFIFSAKKLYREQNPFHNFLNAFKSVHLECLIFKSYPELFSDLEKYAMLLAALMHECDHRGLSVGFLQLTNHPIIDKSEATPVEMYHYDLSHCVFKKSHILDHLNAEDRAKFDNIFKECIKASNVTLYLKRYKTLKQLLTTGTINWENEDHRTLIRTLIVIAGDFSGIAKLEQDVLAATSALYSEFFKEVDILREMNLTIESIPNRDQRFTIPSREETFCTDVVLPCYELLKQLFPDTSPLYDYTVKTIHMWSQMAMEILLVFGDHSKIPQKTRNYLNSIS